MRVFLLSKFQHAQDRINGAHGLRLYPDAGCDAHYIRDTLWEFQVTAHVTNLTIKILSRPHKQLVSVRTCACECALFAADKFQT